MEPLKNPRDDPDDIWRRANNLASIVSTRLDPPLSNRPEYTTSSRTIVNIGDKIADGTRGKIFSASSDADSELVVKISNHSMIEEITPIINYLISNVKLLKLASEDADTTAFLPLGEAIQIYSLMKKASGPTLEIFESSPAHRYLLLQELSKNKSYDQFVASFIQDVGQAILHVRKAGLFYPDMKLGNLCISKKDEKLRVCVLDVNSALDVSLPLNNDPIFQMTLPGTAGYLPREHDPSNAIWKTVPDDEGEPINLRSLSPDDRHKALYSVDLFGLSRCIDGLFSDLSRLDGLPAGALSFRLRRMLLSLRHRNPLDRRSIQEIMSDEMIKGAETGFAAAVIQKVLDAGTGISKNKGSPWDIGTVRIQHHHHSHQQPQLVQQQQHQDLQHPAPAPQNAASKKRLTRMSVQLESDILKQEKLELASAVESRKNEISNEIDTQWNNILRSHPKANSANWKAAAAKWAEAELAPEVGTNPRAAVSLSGTAANLLAEMIKKMDQRKKVALPMPVSDAIMDPRPLSQADFKILKKSEISKTPMNPQFDDFVGEHCLRLRPGVWLSDVVINRYLELLAATFPGCYAFSSFLYPALENCVSAHVKEGNLEGCSFDSVARWGPKQPLTDFRIILAPVFRGDHWTLIAINMQDKTIRFIDSLARDQLIDAHQTLDLFQAWFSWFCWKRNEKIRPLEFKKVIEVNAPQQNNGTDCGVFVCHYARVFCRGANGWDFSTAHAPLLRQHVWLALCRGKIDL